MIPGNDSNEEPMHPKPMIAAFVRRSAFLAGRRTLISLMGILLVSHCAFRRDPGSARAGEVDAQNAVGRHGMVVSVSAPASDIGLSILKKGGNAADAAVATAFALAVTHPAAGNIGGGGFMVLHPARGGEPEVIDYRETAPALATKTMFSPNDSLYGCKVVGIPGTVRGLALAHQRFGKLPWKDLVMPAAKLAEDGFVIEKALASSLNGILTSSRNYPELQKAYGPASGARRWRAGDRLVQADLAATLRLIALNGPDAFYQGPIADKIVAEMKSGGGLISADDLRGYRAQRRQPIHGTYRGYDVYAPPPASSGGICLVEMLNILENFDLKSQGRWSPQTVHLMIEAMRRAYCDRARYLGDSAFTSIPAHLVTKEYGHKLAGEINRKRATSSANLAPDVELASEGDSTTHFSVVDSDGMAVANTYTLERSYGSRVVVKGAGFLLNDEMTDFNWRPGYTDRHGTIGTVPNQIAPGKRMLSSQTPTIVARNGKVLLVTGSPGSRTIINTVLCVLINILDFDMDVRAAVDAPRIHHSWFPDTVSFEGSDSRPDLVKALRRMGHSVHSSSQGDAHSIHVDPRTGQFIGAADRRIAGSARGY
jgi:gamma-glutamyltranspeptidase/glutathione hydrolase